MYLLLYVYDIVLIAPLPSLLQHVIEALQLEVSMKDLVLYMIHRCVTLLLSSEFFGTSGVLNRWWELGAYHPSLP